MLNKRVSHAFGKKIFLLGSDSDGRFLWLEEERWDCGWYWGFGYVETYTNNNRPDRSSDIESHSHFEGFLWGNDATFEHLDGKWVQVKPEYHHHWNQSAKILDTVLTESESWELSDLMKRFYELKEVAEICKNGSSGLSHGKLDSKNEAMWHIINEEMLPQIFNRIKKILTPKESE